MKLSLVSLSLLALAPFSVFAQDTPVDTIVEDVPVEESAPPYVPERLSHFDVEVIFPQKAGVVPELINEREVPLTFKFINNESFPVQVSAFGGVFKYPGKTESYANVSVIMPHYQHLILTFLVNKLKNRERHCK